MVVAVLTSSCDPNLVRRCADCPKTHVPCAVAELRRALSLVRHLAFAVVGLCRFALVVEYAR